MSKGKPLSQEQIDAIKQTVIGQYHEQTEPRAMQDDGPDDEANPTPVPKLEQRAVGYKSPPQATRFKKGQSGNPKGRPRKNTNRATSTAAGSRIDAALLLAIEESFLDEFARTISINEAGQAVEMTAKIGLMRAAIVNALKGNAYAQKTMLDHLLNLESQKAASLNDRIEAWRKHKAKGYETLARIEAGETSLPAPLPHPDDIILEDGLEPHFVGPIVPEVRTILDRLLVRRDHLLLEHAYFERYAPVEAYEREAFQQQLDLMGLERCEDAHIPTGPMMAFILLQRALPPRLRWSRTELLQHLLKLERLTRRQLEKKLSKSRRRQSLHLSRGAFYPSAAFDLRVSQMSQDLVQQQQTKTMQAEEKAKQQGKPFILADADVLSTRAIEDTVREHGFMT